MGRRLLWFVGIWAASVMVAAAAAQALHWLLML